MYAHTKATYLHVDITHKNTRARMIHGRASTKAAISREVRCDPPKKYIQITLVDSHAQSIIILLLLQLNCFGCLEWHQH